jgi:hypothetical protein
MHYTDTIKQLKHNEDCPKTKHKEKLWIIQTIQVWCVYTQKNLLSLVIDNLDTLIQKLIQTYKGPTKKKKTIYKPTIHKHHAKDKHKNIYMHACSYNFMHACICRRGGWKTTSIFKLSMKTNFSAVHFQ